MRAFSFPTLLVLILGPFFWSCSGSKSTAKTKSGVHFTSAKSMEDVLEQAARSDKLVFVDFVTDWCLPCKMMEKDVFSDPGIASFMNEHFINYKVDAEKGNGPLLSMVYEVQSFPTLLFFDIKGEIILRKNGAAYHTELMEMARSALASTASIP